MSKINDKLRALVVDRVKRRLRVPEGDPSITADIIDRAEETEQELQNYLNRDDIPEGLFFAWVRITEAVVKSEITDSEIVDGVTPVRVSSVKEGDTTINLSSGATASTSAALGLALRNYTSELNRYRKMGAL